MRFADSYYALGFWFVAATALFFVWVYRNKKAVMQRFAEPALLEHLTAEVLFRRQIIRWVMILAAMSLGIIALMRPQWGFQWQEVKRRGLDIFIALDTSKSMLATDVKPNRLQRSKLAIEDLVRRLEGDRIGLIAFSGTAFVQCPLTVDYNGFLLALNSVDTDIIPRGGTSLERAIKEAIRAYRGTQKKYKVLVIITDGEDHEGDAIKAAKEAREEGIKIFCIGIGTKEGELIRLLDEKGQLTYLKDGTGKVVKTRLNERILQDVARTTGGTYVRSSGAEFGLDLIYRQNLSKMEKRDIKERMSKLYHERYQLPLTLALLLLIVEPFIGDKRKV